MRKAPAASPGPRQTCSHKNPCTAWDPTPAFHIPPGLRAHLQGSQMPIQGVDKNWPIFHLLPNPSSCSPSTLGEPTELKEWCQIEREIKVQEWFAKSLVVARKDDTRSRGEDTVRAVLGSCWAGSGAGYLGAVSPGKAAVCVFIVLLA